MRVDWTTTVTAGELGVALGGLSARRIRQLAEEGTVSRAARGRYYLLESLAWVADEGYSVRVPREHCHAHYRVIVDREPPNARATCRFCGGRHIRVSRG